MIIRIVKMTFKPEETANFLDLFEKVRGRIREFTGCSHLALYRDINLSDVMFTYSHWDTVEHLNLYKDSEFFGSTWKDTKLKFAAKPEAWSVEQVVGSDSNNLY